MIEVLALFLIVTLSLLGVRVGAVALQKTGLSRESASFQSQSAFMGVGFTTSEAENVVAHPVRRRIIQILMLLGFGAVTSTVGTVILAFARAGDDDMSRAMKLGILAGGLIFLWIGYKIRPLERLLDRVIAKALEETTDLRVLDFEEMLKAHKGYTIANLAIEADDWLADRTLRSLELANEGVLVLSITRENGTILGTPSSRTYLHPGDRILCYGLEEDLTRLAERSPGVQGDREHELAKRRQKLRLVEERVEDELAESEHEDEPAAPSAG